MPINIKTPAGGGVILAATSTASDVTLTLPAETGTVYSTATAVRTQKGVPAFSAYQSVAQALTSNTPTKITFTSVEYDTTGGMFASSRFTPTVAGYYQIQGSVRISTTQVPLVCSIYKNGGEYKRGTYGAAVSNSEVTALVYLNGSTDYLEIYGTSIGVTQNTTAIDNGTYFQGILISAA